MSITHGAWSHKAWKTPGNSVNGLDSGSPDNRGVFVIHGVHLHTGKIMWWSGHAEGVHYTREIIVWDPTNTVPETDPTHSGKRMPDITAIETHLPPGQLDIFCAFHVQLSDGKILIMGGAAHGPSHPTHPGPSDGVGIKNSFIFDPTVAPGAGRHQAFTQKGDMSQERWYPTAVVLDDKSVVVFSGRSEAVSPQSIADKISIFNPPNYDPVDISSTGPDGALPALPSYPSIHMVRGGKMFYTGTNWKYEFNAAGTLPAGGTDLLFLPYLLGERSPHWNPLARAAFIVLARRLIASTTSLTFFRRGNFLKSKQGYNPTTFYTLA